jgi:DNA ligase 1
MHYSRVAQALQEISQAPRGCKADLAAGLLSEIEPDIEMLCPAVRMLLGELWPPWEKREMGIGPEAVMTALAEVSDLDIPTLREKFHDMGTVAEAALTQKGQHSLFREPLKALSVYERLRRISEMSGKESEQRKNALLRGLFLEATPLEGKYIARTALRNNQAGIGHKTMIAALSRLMHCDQEKIRRAFSLMPDLGSIAAMAASRKLEAIAIQPKVPIRFMIIRSGKPVIPAAFLPKYPGLRVQVHKTKGEVLIFTTRLHDITSALNRLSQHVGDIDADFIADADLIGFQERNICSHLDMLRYINRLRFSRKSSISPALLVYDLMFLDGEDITSIDYQERRRRLLSIMGEPKDLPYQGISSAREEMIENIQDADRCWQEGLCVGTKRWMTRSFDGQYRPGESSSHDFLVTRLDGSVPSSWRQLGSGK